MLENGTCGETLRCGADGSAPPPCFNTSPPSAVRSTGGTPAPGVLCCCCWQLPAWAGGGWYRWDGDRRSHAYDAIIAEAARRQQISPYLVKAVIRQESNFQRAARGRSGEIGLMQIMPGAIQDWEHATGRNCQSLGMVFDPRLNIEIGTWYLSRAMNQWHDRPDQVILALAQYNAGPGKVQKWVQSQEAVGENPLDRIRIASTRTYIKNILRYRENYEKHQPQFQ